MIELASILSRDGGGRARREILLKNMERNSQLNQDCRQCHSGKCCTSLANSMQVSALEAVEIYLYLRSFFQSSHDSQSPQSFFEESVMEKIEKCIALYRLDQEIPGNGQRNYLRRTYTCPFFQGGLLGCSLPREIKPYGCLGFNPVVAEVMDGENCRSDQALLGERENHWEGREKELDKEILQVLQKRAEQKGGEELVTFKRLVSQEKWALPMALRMIFLLF